MSEFTNITSGMNWPEAFAFAALVIAIAWAVRD